MNIQAIRRMPTWAGPELVVQAINAASVAGVSALLRLDAKRAVLVLASWQSLREEAELAELGSDRWSDPVPPLYEVLFSEEVDRPNPTWWLYILDGPGTVPHLYYKSGEEAPTPSDYYHSSQITDRRARAPHDARALSKLTCPMCQTEFYGTMGLTLCALCRA